VLRRGLELECPTATNPSVLRRRDARRASYPSPLTLACSLDPITTLDDICFEANGSRPIVQLEEQAASVAQNRARVIATPQRCCAGFTVLADWLWIEMLVIDVS